MKKDNASESAQPLLRPDEDNDAGPSEPPPPTFEESAGHIVVDFDKIEVAPQGGEVPPEFEPYNAEHWVSRNGEIISHDPHLNEDGEALYRFLLSQSQTPPTFFIHCRGTHVESRTRHVTRTDAQGRRRTEEEHYSETVTDFDFTIEHAVPHYGSRTQWTIGDEEPTFRGHMHREVGPPGQTIEAKSDWNKRFDEWREERRMRGLPPWVSSQGSYQGAQVFGGNAQVQPIRRADVLKSSLTLRQWADDYCQSKKIFKEFLYEKVIWGWDLNLLENAIRRTISATHYKGDNVHVCFKSNLSKVIVRPNTRLSRAISNPWLKFLLIITLIYPCIWLFQRFHSRGGGRWTVGGGAYALKRWILVPDYAEPDTLPEIHETPEGPRILIGVREGEWFKRWEGTIRRAVMARKVDKNAMNEPDDVNWSAQGLDGYQQRS
ncbi:hypothetical protein BC834DRAFT_970086 [Gloeopeniophorella convolvens]|nr:hypothetical protein BC834DRAFT_970086 [Gloeopeniophorella convolvens]